MRRCSDPDCPDFEPAASSNPDDVHWPHDKTSLLRLMEEYGIQPRITYLDDFDTVRVWAIWDVENECWLDV